MPLLICAQSFEIKGMVRDSLKNPIAFSSIIASDTPDEQQLLAYTTSKEDGSYVLTFKKTPLDSIWLLYRNMQFATKKIKVAAKSQTIDMLLLAQKNKLDDIIINAKKTVQVKGDTITYDVEGLAKEKDYTIEEVIARIPGVTISENGQISYNNRAISHLYINGVDLLEGNYNIATRGIPASAVKDIDIMQKHNHARIDIGKTDSNDVAFNLKIKEGQSVIFGSARGDVGAPFVTGSAELTPIYLKEKIQDIASLKVNNIGKSLTEYGQSLTNGNPNLAALTLPPINIINKPDMNGTAISNKYWLDNESIAATNDALYKTSTDVIHKSSINYNYDFKQIERRDASVFYVANDSIIINRNTANQLLERKLDASFMSEINTNSLYLKNKTMVSTKNANGLAALTQNGAAIRANYLTDQLSLSNTLEFKNTINGKIINNGLLVHYEQLEEDLKVSPAQFTNELPQVPNAAVSNQANDVTRFNIGAFSAYDFNMSNIKSQFKQTVNWSSEGLVSNLQQLPAVSSSPANFPFASNYELQRLQAISTFSSTLETGKFKLSFNPQLKYLDLRQQERDFVSSKTANSFLFFEPSASAFYKINQHWNSSLSASRNLSISNFNSLFTGLQLRDFASLTRNPSTVNVTRENSLNHFLTYKSILQGIIISNNLRFFQQTADFTFSSTLDGNGLVIVDAIQTPNTLSGWSNRTAFTKTFFKLVKTDLTYNYRNNKSEQIFNNIPQININSAHTAQLELNIDNNTWYGLTYNGLFNYGISQINDFEATNTFIKHNIELDFYLSSKTRWNLGMESVVSSFSNNQNRNQNTLFNSSFFYKPSKKLFLRVSLLNIFNEGFFTTSTSNANFVSQSDFSLRPRQFTLGFNYSL